MLEILVVDRELLAIDAAGGGQTVTRLRLNETVLWKGARGKIDLDTLEEVKWIVDEMACVAQTERSSRSSTVMSAESRIQSGPVSPQTLSL